MKHYYFLLFLFASSFASAQEIQQTSHRYFYKLLNEKFTDPDLNSTCEGSGGAVNSPIAFSKIYNEIFSTIVTGSSDVITNGSAFAYTLDNVKNTFSVNGTTKIFSSTEKSFLPRLFDLGLSIKNKDNNFNYYQNNAWATDISIKVGVVFPLGKGSLFYLPEACEKTNKSRTDYIKAKRDSIILKTSDLIIVNRKIEILNSLKKENAATLQNIKTGYDDLDKKIYLGVTGEIEAYSISELIAAEMQNKATIESILLWNEAAITALRDKYITDFESSDAAKESYTGYSASWLNASFSYTNSSIKIENGSIFDEDIQQKYRSISKGSLTVNFNYQLLRADNGLFFFINAGQRLNRLSYLDNTDFTGKKFTIELNAAGNAYDVKAEEVAGSIGSYHDLHDAVLTTDTYFNLGIIPKSQTNFLGILAKLSVSIPVEGNEHTYTKNYTALLGPLVRLSKIKTFSTATFSILGGFENTGFNKKAWDVFLVKAAVAIPFNIFEKKTK